MNAMVWILSLLVTLSSALAPTAVARSAWVGGVVIKDEFIPLALQFSENGRSAELVLPTRGGMRLGGTVSRTDELIQLDLQSPEGFEIQIESVVESGFLSGQLRMPERALEGSIALIEHHKIADARLGAVAGRYDLEAGGSVWLSKSRVGDLALLTGSLGSADAPKRIVYPLSETEFLVGGVSSGPSPNGVRLEVPRGLKIGEIIFVQPDGTRRRAIASDGSSDRTRLDGLGIPLEVAGAAITQEDVWVKSGEVRLRGTLYKPQGEGPFPAAIIVHGSAPSSRSQLGFHVRLAIDSGLAVLAYDKRGCGESSGEFEPFTVARSASIFSELADDATAAARWLRSRPEIDPKRVGLIGGSQAGWIMPLAGEREPWIAFIAATAGCAVSSGEEAHHGELVRTLGIAGADEALRSYAGPTGFDPHPVLAKLEIPTLWMFGDRDEVIPTRASLESLSELILAGRRNYAVHVFPNTNHNMVNSDTGRPAYLVPLVTRWLDHIGVTHTDSSAHRANP